ncbi:glutathionylspermidine synthase family protein [Candidatus Paracaedibacter symbiosus]|uniref:glutathionylspermidine synthase family protein n=1 Tax=Candidatus Paracaedibacter symbiosus TaxID=244582 RepID=UPI000509B90B|nr:glutathionylspermidine synthase family protein [Candidatus Paracaedibacter symbiosus]
MQRRNQSPRTGWQEKGENLGFHFHTIDGELYWDEAVAYEFTAAEIDTIEDASHTLESLCIVAVEHIIDKKRYAEMQIPENIIDLVEASWHNDHKHLYGRFDLTLDETGVPKLLEYNADTPTALLEAAVVQWDWLQDKKPEADQFNSIHEKLVDAWPRFNFSNTTIHFAGILDNQEDAGTLNYLRDTAMQAGFETELLDMRDVGWNGQGFVDFSNQNICTLFKLYPWEWMMHEEFCPHIINSQTLILEPAWKLLLSNKAVLAILWELFPDHPNLLPADFEAKKIKGDFVRKPFFSREGANIQISQGDLNTDGPYGAEGYVYQKYCPLQNFSGNYPVIGSWIIAGEAAGIGIREDKSPITTNASRFVPHYFV